jgi:hypothetical protein
MAATGKRGFDSFADGLVRSSRLEQLHQLSLVLSQPIDGKKKIVITVDVGNEILMLSIIVPRRRLRTNGVALSSGWQPSAKMLVLTERNEQ